MNSENKCRHRTRPRRANAFTLVELLVVVAIISILMGLTVVVMEGLADQAREEATLATIRKVDRLIEERKDGQDRVLSRNNSLIQRNAINGVLTLLANGKFFAFDNTSPEVLILAKKTAYLFDFPQMMLERTTLGDTSTLVPGNNVVLPVIPDMPDSIFQKVAYGHARQELITEGNSTPTTSEIRDRARAKWAGGTHAGKTFAGHQAHTESAELLYFFLLGAGNYGSTVANADRFTPDEIQDTDNDGLPEFVDAWGQPLRFYRWPTLVVDPSMYDRSNGQHVAFKPVLDDLNDPTDVWSKLQDGTVVGVRKVDNLERPVANLLFKGLPPAPVPLPNNVSPRDMLLTDPDDPYGRLYSALETYNGANGMPDLSLFYNANLFHTPDTYHAPLVVSVGPDNELGLFEPNDVVNGGNLANYKLRVNPTSADFDAMIDAISDNITSRNRRAGGRR